MSNTLEAFITSKPAELRLGQWIPRHARPFFVALRKFVYCYCKPVQVNEQWVWEETVDKLWNLDGQQTINGINKIMKYWQWDSLPDIPSSL